MALSHFRVGSRGCLVDKVSNNKDLQVQNSNLIIASCCKKLKNHLLIYLCKMWTTKYAESLTWPRRRLDYRCKKNGQTFVRRWIVLLKILINQYEVKQYPKNY
jgi:hypothetical protein